VRERVERLGRFEAWGNVAPISFVKLVSEETWEEYWKQLDVVLESMKVAQEKAIEVRDQIKESRALKG
jgi:hypothetical protein